MYAVIRSGGKQYRVEPRQTIEVERVDGEVGGNVVFRELLAVRDDEKKVLGGDHAAFGPLLFAYLRQDTSGGMLSVAMILPLAVHPPKNQATVSDIRAVEIEARRITMFVP